MEVFNKVQIPIMQKTTYKCIAIDDDPIAINSIKHLISKDSEVEFVKGFQNAPFALEYMKNNRVDLVILDVVLPIIDGFSFLKQLPDDVQVILTSSYSLQGEITHHVRDYLKKPLSELDFKKAIMRFIKEKKSARDLELKRDDYSNVRLNNIKAILFFKRIKNTKYEAHLTTGIVVPVDAAFVENQISENSFVKVNKEHIVNKIHVKVLGLNFLIVGKKELPMDFSLRDDVEKLMSKNLV